MGLSVRSENGLEIRHEETPEGTVEVDSHVPNAGPWDYYGGKHQRTIMKVLRAAGLSPVPLVTHRRNLSPMGSGPGGRVRFGDDMVPGVYRVAVPRGQSPAAAAAILSHRADVDRWLFHDGAMPEVYRD